MSKCHYNIIKKSVVCTLIINKVFILYFIFVVGCWVKLSCPLSCVQTPVRLRAQCGTERVSQSAQSAQNPGKYRRTMLALINRILDWIKSLFWKEEMELTLVGLQYSGKTTFVNVIAVMLTTYTAI